MMRLAKLGKPALFVLCLTPLAWLVFDLVSDNLGANPIEALVRGLGDWALRMLLAVLAITPLRQATGWGWIGRQRRMVGLFAFTYAVLHLFSYIGIDQFFDWRLIAAEIVKRRYILIGMTAFLMLAALAATSTNGSIRRLGGRRWKQLHRLVYLAAGLGVLHHLMMVKADTRLPLIEGAVLAFLLLWRAVPGLNLKARLNLKDRAPQA